jgi:hypothetical protein
VVAALALLALQVHTFRRHERERALAVWP